MPHFISTIWSHYRTHKRDMLWRRDTRPYYIVVSEIMLQQTQVHRVTSKFTSFIARFPDWRSLAKASTKEVLQEWSGLGYNRRALYLKQIAETITENGKHAGTLPQTIDGLRQLPGIGPNTAGSILAFAFNKPTAFIETNIRSVFIHFFFPEIEMREGKKACKKVTDDQLMPLIEKALRSPQIKKNPREWYWALMDYGSFLKKTLPNPSRRSAHHVKQKPFKGSNREVRSKILRLVMEKSRTEKEISRNFSRENIPHQKVTRGLKELMAEGFIIMKKRHYQIVGN